MSNFPVVLDTFTSPLDPAAGQYVWQDGTIRNGTGPSAAILVAANPALIHENQHNLLNIAVAALEAKVGINGSTVPTSLDYRIGQAIPLAGSLGISGNLGSDNGSWEIFRASGGFSFANGNITLDGFGNLVGPWGQLDAGGQATINGPLSVANGNLILQGNPSYVNTPGVPLYLGDGQFVGNNTYILVNDFTQQVNVNAGAGFYVDDLSGDTLSVNPTDGVIINANNNGVFINDTSGNGVNINTNGGTNNPINLGPYTVANGNPGYVSLLALREVDIGNGSYSDPSPGNAYDLKCGGPHGGMTTGGQVNANLGFYLNNSPIIDASRNISPASIVGVSTSSSAPAGAVGELISSNIAVGSAVSLVNNTAKTVTSISLTAGDWDVSATVAFSAGALTTSTAFIGAVSATNNTLPTIAGSGGYTQVGLSVSAGGLTPVLPTGTVNVKLASTTTIFLVAESTFATSTMSAYGFLRATRVR